MQLWICAILIVIIILVLIIFLLVKIAPAISIMYGGEGFIDTIGQLLQYIDRWILAIILVLEVILWAIFVEFNSPVGIGGVLLGIVMIIMVVFCSEERNINDRVQAEIVVMCVIWLFVALIANIYVLLNIVMAIK